MQWGATIMLLAGDIGGTKTILALFSSETKLREPLKKATFSSAHYPSLADLVQGFLSDIDFPIDRACFGVPGPVIEGRAKTTNLPWAIDEVQLQKALHIPSIRLLNDLTAMAHSIPLLQAEDLCTLNEGTAEPHTPLAIIAPGTGLGEGFLTWDGTCYIAHASEGGHADFAPTNQLEIGLLHYLLERFEHVSYEQVCSGIGIPHLYAYLKETSAMQESALVAEKMALARDINPIIFEAAFAKDAESALCLATLKTFVAILGAEAGNLALKVLATGGIYLGGGIPPRILSLLKDGTFMRAFQHKGRFSELLAHVPVHVILHPHVALIGAAYYGFTL